MCGLAGYVDRSGKVAQSQAVLERMMHMLKHRGPDGFGFHAAPASAPQHYSLVFCNPPYLATTHAKQMPIAVGGWSRSPCSTEAPQTLLAGGWLCFEIGAGQHALVQTRIAQNVGYRDLRPGYDRHGAVRAFQVTWD